MKRCEMAMLAAGLLLTACAGQRGEAPTAKRVDEATFRRHLAALSSDEFEGRKPATRAEEKTVEYIRQQFEAAGLKPGNGATHFQSVPLVEITADPDMALTVSRGGDVLKFKYADGMVAWTKRVAPNARLEDRKSVV